MITIFVETGRFSSTLRFLGCDSLATVFFTSFGLHGVGSRTLLLEGARYIRIRCAF